MVGERFHPQNQIAQKQFLRVLGSSHNNYILFLREIMIDNSEKIVYTHDERTQIHTQHSKKNKISRKNM